MQKRGQSAVEFLTTYGWYILIVLIVIIVLAYAGLFDKKTYTEIDIEEPIQVSDFRISNESIDIMMRLSPDADEATLNALTINDIYCEKLGGSIYNSKISQNLSLVGCNNIKLNMGEKVSGEIFISYKKINQLNHDIVGGYIGKVENANSLLCGNKILDTDEECDDGNLEINDGCNKECKFTHRNCGGDYCVDILGQGENLCSSSLDCMVKCNNNGKWEPVLEEQCDYDDKPSCQDKGYEIGTTSCSHCRLDISKCHTCDNRVIEGPEECDFSEGGAIIFKGDGTCRGIGLIGEGTLSCYPKGTSNECKYDKSQCGFCGDQIITAPVEQCDFNGAGSPIITSTCKDVLGGAYSESVKPGCYPPASDQKCTYNTSNCKKISCGNGLVDTLYGEECDWDTLGNIIITDPTLPQSCTNLKDSKNEPFTQGKLKCDPQDCVIDSSDCHTCGNVLIEGPEECDRTNLGIARCTDFPGYNGGILACYPLGNSKECKLFKGGCTQSCGNGILELQYDEECDDGNLADMDSCNHECKITHNICEGSLCKEVFGPGTNQCSRNDDISAILGFNSGGSTSGDTTPDSSGENNNGLIYESVAASITKDISNCKYGTCYIFEMGTNPDPLKIRWADVNWNKGYIKPVNSLTASEFSVEMWFQIPTGIGNPTKGVTLIYLKEGTQFISLGLSYSTLVHGARYPEAPSLDCFNKPITVCPPVSIGPWYHYAFTCGRYGKHVYLNGNEVTWLSSVGSDCLGTKEMYIGGQPDGKDLFDGKIDNVLIFNRQLSQTEIQNHISLKFDSCDSFTPSI